MTPHGEQTDQLAKNEWPRRIWQALALLLSLFVLEQNLEDMAVGLRLHPYAGYITDGAVLDRDAGPRGAFRVLSVQPQSLLASEGVRAGALLIPDRPMDFLQAVSVKQRVGVTVVQDHRTAHLQLVPQQKTGAPDWARVSDTGALTVCLAFAVLLILASRGRPAPLMLGVALVGYAEAFYFAQPLASGLAAVWIDGLTGFIGALTFIMFLAFALRLHQDAIGRASRRLGWIAAAVMGLVVLAFAYRAWWRTTGSALAPFGSGRALSDWAPQIDFALALLILIDAYRRSRAEMRQRHALLLITFGLVVICQAAAWILSGRTEPPFVVANHVSTFLASLLAPALFAYAILRQRVMDVAFAINRTLIYGGVSLVLLVAFGLLEWAVAHFVPVQGKEKNAFIDAGLALVVFLAFHRVRDFTEHIVEALFFRRWQRQEADLRRFLRDAAFITRPESLARAAVMALERFGDGALVAIYLREEGGDLHRLEGHLNGPGRIDADHPALVRLRAEPKPMQVDDGAGLHATLIAPMLNRNVVTGAVLFGAKPDVSAWRPDELALIGQASVQIGQDLHVLEVERLERLTAELKQQNTLLKQLHLPAT